MPICAEVQWWNDSYIKTPPFLILEHTAELKKSNPESNSTSISNQIQVTGSVTLAVV